MYIVLMRNMGSTSIDMLFHEDWDMLKIEMCRQMEIESDFNAHDGWSRLRNGDVILHGGMFFCLVDTESPQKSFNSVGYAALFKGEVVEFTDEDELRDIPSFTGHPYDF